jgi:protein-disulfide isomerase
MRRLLLLALLPAACARPRSPGASPEIVAEAGDVRVTRVELEAEAAGRLLPLKSQEYDTLRESLEDLLFERLVKREAQARRVSPEVFVQGELKLDRSAPDPKEVEAIYQANRDRLGQRSVADAKAEIVRLLEEERAREARSAFRKDLFHKAGVRVYLPPPRLNLQVPADAPVLGPPDARVTLVEFADYQCPYCQQAESIVEGILDKNPKTVRFVLRDFPLDTKHARALPAAEAAHCAEDQGKFFEYRRSLLGTPGNLSDEDLVRRAEGLHLKTDAFRTCLAARPHEAEIRKSFEDARALGVSATPTFFVNGRYVEGLRSEGQLQDIIDSELATDR